LQRDLVYSRFIMPYRKVIFYPTGYYHIYNRGNRKNNIFFDKGDYVYFLTKIKQYKTMYCIKIIAYCLMPNHFHLLIQQVGDASVSEFMRHCVRDYAIFVNNKYGLEGRLFQGPFKARTVQTDEYLLHLSRYIHLNPLDIGIALKELAAYPWSSYPEYIGMRNGILPEFNFVVDLVVDYKQYVLEGSEYRIKDGLKELTID